MNKLSFYSYRIILWLWDVVSLNVVLLLLAIFIERADAFQNNEYYLFFLAFNMLWMASVFITALYLSKNWLDVGNFAVETMKSYFLTVLALLFFVFIFKKEYSRLFITLSLAGFGLALVINRFAFYVALEALKKEFPDQEKCDPARKQ
jgi:putative colanic acid biosysnthesis UDP-glucose lipid carrier transferase